MKKKNTKKNLSRQQELFPKPKQLKLPLMTMKEYLIEKGFDQSIIVDSNNGIDNYVSPMIEGDRISDNHVQYQAGREMVYAN